MSKEIRPPGLFENEIALRYPATTFDQVAARLSDPDFIRERQRQFHNLVLVEQKITELVVSKGYTQGSVVEACRLIDDAIVFVVPKETRPQGLVEHIERVQNSATSFFDALNALEPKSETPILKMHKQKLVCHATELHDQARFLVHEKGQINADHELIMAHLVRSAFQKLKVNKKDTEFIAQLIEHHGNIRKENRTGFIDSQNPLDRAKALFFIFDVLPDVIDTDKLKERQLVINSDSVGRLGDIIFRHTELVLAKEFNPDWGVEAVEELASTLQCVAKRYSLTIEPGMHEVLFRSVYNGLQELLKQDVSRRRENEIYARAGKSDSLPLLLVRANCSY